MSPRSVAFLPREPWTKPYDDPARDPYADALTLRRLSDASGGVLEAYTRRELARLSYAARMPFAAVERALDAATWRGLGEPAGEGLYRFFAVDGRAQ